MRAFLRLARGFFMSLTSAEQFALHQVSWPIWVCIDNAFWPYFATAAWPSKKKPCDRTCCFGHCGVRSGRETQVDSAWMKQHRTFAGMQLSWFGIA